MSLPERLKVTIQPRKLLTHSAIMLNLEDDLQRNGKTKRPGYFLGGPNVSTNKLTLQGQINTIGIRFHPGGNSRFMIC